MMLLGKCFLDSNDGAVTYKVAAVVNDSKRGTLIEVVGENSRTAHRMMPHDFRSFISRMTIADL